MHPTAGHSSHCFTTQDISRERNKHCCGQRSGRSRKQASHAPRLVCRLKEAKATTHALPVRYDISKLPTEKAPMLLSRASRMAGSLHAFLPRSMARHLTHNCYTLPMPDTFGCKMPIFSGVSSSDKDATRNSPSISRYVRGQVCRAP